MTLNGTKASQAESAGGRHQVEDQSEVLTFLSQSATYGLSERPVRIDTHAAVVFLAGEHAYKLKRSVRYPFLDFSTLERRKAVCEAELTVNCRNAPNLYIDTMPVVRRDGSLHLGGAGEPVEWLVRMRRFNPQNTLDQVAEREELTSTILSCLVETIINSHRRAPLGDGATATDRLIRFIESNGQELAEAPHIFPIERSRALERVSKSSFDAAQPLLVARGRAGHVRRCHGDLHLGNIVLLNGQPTLFDALEFDEAMATSDVLYDLAFLLMDLWHRKLRREANEVFNRYLWQTDNISHIEASRVLPLFMSIRAAIRAKVTAAKLDYLGGTSRDTAVAEALSYFETAEECLVAAQARLIAVGGLSGTGKTTVAASLAPQTGGPPGAIHLRSDIERKRLFKVPNTERLPPLAYSEAATGEVYERLRRKASRALAAGHAVVVDAVHARPDERRAIEAVAREAGVTFMGLWLHAPNPDLLRRVTARQADASDADAAVVRHQLGYDVGTITWTLIDAGRDREVVCADAAAAMRTCAGFTQAG